MASGTEENARASRKAKGLPEPNPADFWIGIALKLAKGINVGSLGKLASMFSATHTKMFAAIIGNLVGAGVSLLLGWLAFTVPAIATCTTVAAEQTCTLSILGHAYSQAEITVALMGIIMTWLAAHVTSASPANKP